MARLVYYSLALSRDEPRPDLIRQLDASVGTLRIHNHDISVALFLHGPMAPDLAAVCQAHNIMVHDQGPYEHRLAAFCPIGWPALARYPLLHKFLNFRQLAAAGASQILYCDCDTVFFDDVAKVFDYYAGPDVVAREEVHTSRSPHGIDWSFVDEPLLARLAAKEGAAPIPPFNLGVVLFNNDVWHRFASLDGLVIDYAWRFVTWMAQHPAIGAAAEYGEFIGAGEAARLIGSAEAARALPFPSDNRWILDEVALWMALGHVPGVRMADFKPGDVAQNGEFGASDPHSAGWILCHYFSQNMGRIDAWLRDRSALATT